MFVGAAKPGGTTSPRPDKQAGTFRFLVQCGRRGIDVFSFLTPGLFDILVLIVITVGILAAARRIYQDFQRGPRWPEDSLQSEASANNVPGERPDRE
jgi:hypothetical protein